MTTKSSKPSCSNCLPLLIPLFLLIIPFTCDAQKNMAGLYWGVEANFEKHVGSPYLGINYERKITDEFGIETGAHWNFIQQSKHAFVNGQNYSGGTDYFLVNIPVLLKTYTRVINLAGGLAANILIAEKEVGDKDIPMPDEVPDLTWGYVFKASKPFNTKAPFVLEPEISLGNRREFKEPNIGAALALKYKF